MKPTWPNHEPKHVGQTVRAVHPCNAGRYPDGIVTTSEAGADELEHDYRASVTVAVGIGSTVYGPAQHWQPIAAADARLEWLESSDTTLEMLGRAGVQPERLDAMRRTADAMRAAIAARAELEPCPNCGRTDPDEPGYPCDVCGSPGTEPEPLEELERVPA